MPGLVPGIHVFKAPESKDVDGRDKPGHDAGKSSEVRPRYVRIVRTNGRAKLHGIQFEGKIG
jgi:hypothetical protein